MTGTRPQQHTSIIDSTRTALSIRSKRVLHMSSNQGRLMLQQTNMRAMLLLILLTVHVRSCEFIVLVPRGTSSTIANSSDGSMGLKIIVAMGIIKTCACCCQHALLWPRSFLRFPTDP